MFPGVVVELDTQPPQLDTSPVLVANIGDIYIVEVVFDEQIASVTIDLETDDDIFVPDEIVTDGNAVYAEIDISGGSEGVGTLTVNVMDDVNNSIIYEFEVELVAMAASIFQLHNRSFSLLASSRSFAFDLFDR